MYYKGWRSDIQQGIKYVQENMLIDHTLDRFSSLSHAYMFDINFVCAWYYYPFPFPFDDCISSGQNTLTYHSFIWSFEFLMISFFLTM